MARIEFGDIEALMDDLRQLGEDTEEMALEIVTEQQDILYEAQQKTAESMLQGPYYAGDVKAGMHVKTPFSTGNGAEARITFEGTAHGNRIGEIAFINEYGKTNQPARPFIQMAIEQENGNLGKAADKIVDKYLKKAGL